MRSVAAPGLGIWGGHLRGNTHLGGGGKIEFHEIFPPPHCQNFSPPGFFSKHFFRSFFPDISNFFPDISKLFRPTKIFSRPTKNVIFLAKFHKFLQFCLSNSDVSTTFGHFSQKSPLWFLHPWLSATNGFYRNYQELGGGGKMRGGAENNFGGAFAPVLAPPPGAATECVVSDLHPSSPKLFVFLINSNIHSVSYCGLWRSGSCVIVYSDSTMFNNIVDNIEQYGQHNIVQCCFQQPSEITVTTSFTSGLDLCIFPCFKYIVCQINSFALIAK